MSGAAKTPFADLLAGLQQNKISLADVIQSLNARGPVQSPLHKAELGMLDEALARNRIDATLHRLLGAKLKDVQLQKPVVEKTMMMPAYTGPVAGDKTVMNPSGAADKTVMNPAGGDKTVVNPGGAVAGEKTVLNPSSAADKTVMNPAGGDRTVVNPGSNGGGEGEGFDLLMSAEDEKTQMGGQETTGFKPSEPVTGSRTGGTSGPSTSSWQRVAVQGGPEREVHAGDTLKDRFYLEKEVGRGGMGIVFKARDERKVEAQDKNPWVAVKVLNSEFRKHPQALVALQRESRKAQQLTHDNILRVFDFDKDGTIIYMTMEYVEGGSLKDVIKQHPNGMPFDKGWPIIAGLARGLDRAHRDNIVHSDFKPGNVMMTSDMIPKLFDLGIARAAQSGGEAKGETTVFDAGELGALTPAYASLEMIQGHPPQLIDDIYALGITAYEILTGKHPFGKKNAEQAMKAGMKPPVVPGLSRMQQRTLQAAVAFKREDRLPNCEALLDGLRPRTMKDYALPITVGGFAVVLVLVGIFGALLPYLENRRVDAMIAQFQQGAFTAPDQALAALNAMGEDEREKAKQRGGKDIQNFFFNIANERWNLAAKPPKYEHPAALAAVQAAQSLFPDSAAVADNLRRLDDEKRTELSRLDTEFGDHLQAGRVYEDKDPNIVQTVAIVRQIDPASTLLKDQRLLQRYSRDVKNALETGEFEIADKRAATAVKVFPGEQELVALQSSVKQGREMQLAAARERELRAKMTADEAKVELAKLAANPLFTPDWQVNVNVAMSKLTADASPETQQLKSQLAEAYAKQLAGKLDARDVVGGQMVADAGSKLFTSVPSFTRELGRLSEMRKAQQAEEAAKMAAAEVVSLKRTVQVRAEANDLRGSQAALDKLRALAPTDPFLSGDGPKVLADAYLRQAERQAEQGRYEQAQQFVANGLKVVPSHAGLKERQKQYRIEGSVALLQDGASSPASANGDKLKSALEILRTEDPARYGKLSNELQSTALARIQALVGSDPAGANRGKTEWLKVFPQNTQLASLTIAAAAAPAATTPSLPQEARRARRAPGVDTCNPQFATFGKSSRATCQDEVEGAPGPKLVVVPSPGGGVFAITKYEIKVAEFDAFCRATGKCKPAGGNDTMPRTNVSLALAKAYAAWLSEVTGFNYRLPTDAEWAHAANAGGAGPGEASNFNCIVMSGSSQIKGGIAVPVTTGGANAWGLVNAVGNAAEWVDGGTARGGHFNVPTTQCGVDWRQSGGDSETVGLRLVREMG